MKKILLLLMLVCLPLSAQNILFVSENYVLIDTDQNVGGIGDYLNVFRKVNGRFQNIGTVQIAKFQNGKAAAKILFAKVPIQKNDRVHTIAATKSPLAKQEAFRKSSLGLHYHLMSFLGDSKDDFLLANGVELEFEQRFGNHFALRGMFNYSYMEWEMYVGYGIFGVYQYAEPEAYGIAFSPVLRLPILQNRLELSIAPIFALSQISVWYEVDFNLPGYSLYFDEELDAETRFSFGTDAAVRVNVLERVGLEAGVRWQNLDVLGGFADYDVMPVDLQSYVSDVPEIEVDVTTLIYRFGLVLHF